jgi:hypothetical protein
MKDQRERARARPLEESPQTLNEQQNDGDQEEEGSANICVFSSEISDV